MLAYHGLLAAAYSISLVWAGSVSGSKRCGGGLHGRLVLAVLVFVASPQSGFETKDGPRDSSAAVAVDDRLGASGVAVALCRSVGGHGNSPRTLGDGVSRVSWSLAICVAGPDSDLILHRRVWRVVPGCMGVGFLILRCALLVRRWLPASSAAAPNAPAAAWLGWRPVLWTV